MRVLLACEESQAVTTEFRKLGHEAFSCDLEPCSGIHPEWHLQEDVLPLLTQDWDLIIAFPPCTYLTVTGNRWFNVEKYGEKALQRGRDREEAVDFFLSLVHAKCEKIAVENPVGIISSRWRKPDQIIHPWMFGDPFEKRTCLWLKGLPLLKPTTEVASLPARKTFESGKSMPEWYASTWKLPPKERARVRSRTFQGIAKAMAEQWGSKEKR